MSTSSYVFVMGLVTLIVTVIVGHTLYAIGGKLIYKGRRSGSIAVFLPLYLTGAVMYLLGAIIALAWTYEAVLFAVVGLGILDMLSIRLLGLCLTIGGGIVLAYIIRSVRRGRVFRFFLSLFCGMLGITSLGLMFLLEYPPPSISELANEGPSWLRILLDLLSRVSGRPVK